MGPRTLCAMLRDPKRLCAAAVLLATPLIAHAVGSAVVTQSADVRSAPSASAQPVAEAPPNEPIQILDRQGAWYEVSSTSGWRGWMRMAAVKLTALTQKKSTASGNPFQPAAVIGVRGMDEADLARAQPNYAELVKLRTYRATPQDADQFAAQLPRGATR